MNWKWALQHVKAGGPIEKLPPPSAPWGHHFLVLIIIYAASCLLGTGDEGVTYFPSAIANSNEWHHSDGSKWCWRLVWLLLVPFHEAAEP